MSINIEFTPGLPAPGEGTCIFLLWDGMLCEGVLHRVEGRLMLTHYNLSSPGAPEQITIRADTGKVQAFARLMGHKRAAA